MRRVDSDNCRTYSDAERLLYNAKVYLQTSAPKVAIPPYRKPFYEALRILAQAQHRVLEEWAAHVAHNSSGVRDWAA